MLCATGCTEETEGVDDEILTLSVAPYIAGASQSYQVSQKESFEIGDKVSIVLWEGDVPPPATEALYVDNATSTQSSEGVWSIDEVIDISTLTSTYNVAAIYPSVEEKGVDELQTIDIDLNSDWFYGSLRTKLTTSDISIESYPLLAELSFSLLDGSIISSPQVSGLATSGTFNIFDGSLKAGSQTGSVNFESTSLGYSAKLIPQSIKWFEITVDGRNYTYSGSTITLNSGDMCEIELALQTDGTVTIDSITINPWGEYDDDGSYDDLELTTPQN